MNYPSLLPELSLLPEPMHVDEPREDKEFSAALNQVVSGRFPVIVCRNGEDLAAVIPMEYFEVLQEILAWQDLEKRAAQIDWDKLKGNKPPQEWYDDNDNPFEPEEEPAS